MDHQKNLTAGPAFPWMTLTMALMSAAALLLGSVASCLIYDRGLIFKGQLWRLWSGHVVHFGLSHFTWNLAVFLPAGIWLERLWPALTRCFYALSPLIISAALLLLDSTLMRYAGLSGIATGMLVLLACLQLGRRNDEPAWFWVSVLALVGIKTGVELFTGAPVFVSGFGDIRTVPLAHIFGIVSALAFWLLALRAKKTAARR